VPRFQFLLFKNSSVPKVTQSNVAFTDQEVQFTLDVYRFAELQVYINLCEIVEVIIPNFLIMLSYVPLMNDQKSTQHFSE
jgi:hypothetical protein